MENRNTAHGAQQNSELMAYTSPAVQGWSIRQAYPLWASTPASK